MLGSLGMIGDVNDLALDAHASVPIARRQAGAVIVADEFSAYAGVASRCATRDTTPSSY